MNERIKELATQAGSIYDPQETMKVFNKEKFAELIVKECAAMARNLCPHGTFAEGEIKDHFGVE